MHEGESINITCISFGVPVPTISWSFNGQATHFSPTDQSFDVSVSGDVVTLGSTMSSLLIVNAQYPDNDGTYICTGSNTQSGASSSMINVEVLGMLTKGTAG